jgi:hypothetical protein
MSAAQKTPGRREGDRTGVAAELSPGYTPEVAFCALERVGQRAFLSLCSTTDWRVFRLDGLAAASDRVAPVQVRSPLWLLPGYADLSSMRCMCTSDIDPRHAPPALHVQCR